MQCFVNSNIFSKLVSVYVIILALINKKVKTLKHSLTTKVNTLKHYEHFFARAHSHSCFNYIYLIYLNVVVLSFYFLMIKYLLKMLISD